MSTKQGPSHVVVDGSNIATEGRSMPSLAQLSEAVASFMEEYPDTAITVVVDATFGHRIAKNEVAEFEAGIANNELVAPPAGAVGRGDAFVLGIANKAGSSVLSNDSFQEFHAEYLWLFDEGRLIGGKPVPHVGWVWVDRVPVRGPVSRKVTRGGGQTRRSSGSRSRRRSDDDESTVRTGSKEASAPMPTPKTPPPGRAAVAVAAASESPKSESAKPAAAAPKGGDPVNELMPFLDFVEHHPVGTSINGTVDAYSSHGAYVTIVDSGVRAYVPLRLMAEPTPRSAKSVMKIGESVTLVVVSFAPARRSIDCAVPDLADQAIAEAGDTAGSDENELAAPSTPVKQARSQRTGAKKTATKKAAAKRAVAAAESMATTAPSKRTVTKKTVAKKTPAKQAVPKQAVPKQAVAKRAAAKKVAAPKQSAASSRVAQKPAAADAAPKKAAASKAPAKKAPAKKAPAKKAPAKKAAANKAVPKKAIAKKAPAKKATVKRTGAK